jgi:RNA polymerase sigma factor (TIGR02999 family)
MTLDSSEEITRLLQAWTDGDREAFEKLAPLVYKQLRRLAMRYLRQERAGHTLQTTALVNEAFVRMIRWQSVPWQNRAHFFAVSAQLMRRILVDHARRYHRAKRGGSMRPVSLDQTPEVSAVHGEELIAVDEALDRLAAIDARSARVVELRFFGGMSVDEMAEVLKVSHMTISRDWEFAKAWLLKELRRRPSRGKRQ